MSESKARELSQLADELNVDASGNASFTGDVAAANLSTTGSITVGGTVDGRDIAADGAKLDGIEAGATADQTGAEIKALYEAELDTNGFTDAEKTKLAGIEAGATADQTGSEIKALYEAEANTNAFTDAEKTKLSGIEAGATADQTAAEILAALVTVDGAGSALDADTLDGKQLSTIESEYQAYATAAAAALVDAAPAALNTLNELAAALGDDANFSTTVTNSIATKLATAGGTMTGALAFGDSVKATFGTGDDLEIYHDGSNSYVKDSGTGNLYIQGAPYVYIGDTAGEVSAAFNSNGAASLRYDNSTKLETTSDGVSVTGNVYTTGAFAFDSTDYIGWSNNSHIQVAVNGAVRARFESDGDFHADGDIIAFSTTISDPRLKTDIQKIEGALDKLCTLSGYTFTYTPDGKESAGVLSTEVAEVLPSAIRPKKLPLKTGDDETVYDTVQYDQLHGLLIEAIKELRKEVADLKAKIEG